MDPIKKGSKPSGDYRSAMTQAKSILTPKPFGVSIEYGSNAYNNAYNKNKITSYNIHKDLHRAKDLPAANVTTKASSEQLLKAEYARKNPIPKNTKWNDKGELISTTNNIYDGVNPNNVINNWYSNRDKYVKNNSYKSMFYEESKEIRPWTEKSLLTQMEFEKRRELSMLNSEEGIRRIGKSMIDLRPRFRGNTDLINAPKPKNPQTVPQSSGVEYYDEAKQIAKDLYKTKNIIDISPEKYIAYHSGAEDVIAQNPNYPITSTFAHEENHNIFDAKEKWQDRYLRDNIEFNKTDDNKRFTDYMLKNSDELTAYLRGTRQDMVAHGLIKHPYDNITAEKLKEAYAYFNNSDNNNFITKQRGSEKEFMLAEKSITEIISLAKQNILDEILANKNSNLNELEKNKQIKKLENELLRLDENLKSRLTDLEKAKNEKAKTPYINQGNRFFESIKPTEENFKHLEKVLKDLASNNVNNPNELSPGPLGSTLLNNRNKLKTV